MQFTYTRELGVDFTASEVHVSSFYNELNASSLPEVLGLYRQGNLITVRFERALTTQEEIDFDTIVSNYEYVVFDNTFAIIKDIKPLGTHGGTATAGSWETRDLNYVEGNQNFVSVSNNQVVLDEVASLYNVYISAPAYRVKNHQIRLYDVTNDQVIAYGSSAYSDAKVVTCSIINTMYNKPNGPVTLEVQHQVEKTSNKQGYGIASSFEESETYTVMTIQRF